MTPAYRAILAQAFTTNNAGSDDSLLVQSLDVAGADAEPVAETSVLCSANRGDGLTGAGAPSNRTGNAGMRSSPFRCFMVWMMPGSDLRLTVTDFLLAL